MPKQYYNRHPIALTVITNFNIEYMQFAAAYNWVQQHDQESSIL